MAVLDIGSNATRMIVGGLDAHGIFVRHLFMRVPLPLGLESYGKDNAISVAVRRRLVFAVQGLGKIAEAMVVSHRVAIATAAIRDCRNRQSVLSAIRRTGVLVRVLDGKEEAAISGAFVARQFRQRTVLNIDSGGGSTDCARICGDALAARATFAIGTARTNCGTAAEKQKLQRWLAAHYSRGAILASSGGGARKLEIACGRGGITANGVQKFLRAASAMPIEQRAVQFDLTPDRAHNIIPAAEIALCVLQSTKAQRLHTVKGGLGEAVLIEMLRAKN